MPSKRLWRWNKPVENWMYEDVVRAARETAADKPIVPFNLTPNAAGSMFTTFFLDGPAQDWSTVRRADTGRFGRFFQAMLAEGVYLAPSQFEAGFMTTAHSDEAIEATIEAARKAFQKVD